jgi:diacylglycerol kinase family enzyme
MAGAPPRSLLIVANADSGRGRAGRWAARAEAVLRRAGCEVERAGDREELAARLADPSRFEEFWAFGGDGTLSDLIRRLPVEPRPRIAIFPAGTGNVVARELGVPLRFGGALEVALHGRARPFDVPAVNGRRFAFMLSAGIDAELAHEVARRRRGPMRRSDWLRAALAIGGAAREAPLQVEADGEELGEARYAALFNCSLYAGGFRVCPSARVDDGLLQLLILREPVAPRYLRVVWRALRHRPESLPDAILRAVRTARLRGVERAQVDGDPAEGGDLSIALAPSAIELRAPA